MGSYTAYIMLTLILESMTSKYQFQHGVHKYTEPEYNIEYKLDPNPSNLGNLLLAS